MAKSAAQEVPYILAAHGELHVASILERLRERGYSKIKYQSLSAELSVNTKNKRLYKRTAPATSAQNIFFARLRSTSQTNAPRRRRPRFAPKFCARPTMKYAK